MEAGAARARGRASASTSTPSRCRSLPRSTSPRSAARGDGARALSCRRSRAASSGASRGRVTRPRPRRGTETRYLQGAVVVLDARSGDVLAWVGGRDSAQSRFDRVAARAAAGGQRLQAVRLCRGLRRGYALAEPLLGPALQRSSSTSGNMWEPQELRRRAPRAAVIVREALVPRRTSLRCAWRAAVGRATVAAGAARGHRAAIDAPAVDGAGHGGRVAAGAHRRVHARSPPAACGRRRGSSCASRRVGRACCGAASRCEPPCWTPACRVSGHRVPCATRSTRGSGAGALQAGFAVPGRRQDGHDQRRGGRLVRRLHAGGRRRRSGSGSTSRVRSCAARPADGWPRPSGAS